MNDDVKCYKAFDPDLSCRGFLYAVGREYCICEHPRLCSRGFHFCPSLSNVYWFYPVSPLTRVCLVTPLGETVCQELDDFGSILSAHRLLVEKCCTDRLRIDRELEPDEIVRALMDDRNEFKGMGMFSSANHVNGIMDILQGHSNRMVYDPRGTLSASLQGEGVKPEWIAERAGKFRSAFMDAFSKEGRQGKRTQ